MKSHSSDSAPAAWPWFCLLLVLGTVVLVKVIPPDLATGPTETTPRVLAQTAVSSPGREASAPALARFARPAGDEPIARFREAWATQDASLRLERFDAALRGAGATELEAAAEWLGATIDSAEPTELVALMKSFAEADADRSLRLALRMPGPGPLELATAAVLEQQLARDPGAAAATLSRIEPADLRERMAAGVLDRLALSGPEVARGWAEALPADSPVREFALAQTETLPIEPDANEPNDAPAP